jgi:hypothetical protein
MILLRRRKQIIIDDSQIRPVRGIFPGCLVTPRELILWPKLKGAHAHTNTHNNRRLTKWMLPLIHSVFCLTTGPKPLSKSALHIVRSRASYFKWRYPLLSLGSSSSFLRLLPSLPVTYIFPFVFPSTTRCRRQFLRRMWPIQLAFSLLISCRIFLCSLTLSNTSSFLTWSVQLIFSIHFQHHI